MKPAWCYAVRVVVLVAYGLLAVFDAPTAYAVGIPLLLVVVLVVVSDEITERSARTRWGAS